MIHHLKTWPEFFKAVFDGHKRFEIRKNDRNFQVGDRLVLHDYDPKNELYSGYSWDGEVTYITDFEQKPGYVVMGIR